MRGSADEWKSQEAGWTCPGSSFRVEWAGPEPRPGLRRLWDVTVGPGYTRGELWLWVVVVLAGALGAVAYPYFAGAQWRWWQYLLALIIAADILGGAAVNASAPAKRWYHRPQVGNSNHAAFVGVHVIHIAVVAAVYHENSLAYFLVMTAALGACTLVTLLAPLHLRRPLASVGTVVGLTVLAAGPGFTPWLTWFEPAMFMKLVVGYLVFDAPFRLPNS